MELKNQLDIKRRGSMTQSCSGESEQSPNPVVAPDPQQKVLSKYLEERRDEYCVLQLEAHWPENREHPGWHYQYRWVLKELDDWHPKRHHSD